MDGPLTDARLKVLRRLKVDGPSRLSGLAESLGLTTEAVRQHLTAMADEGLVRAQPLASAERGRGRGRPPVVWSLGDNAARYFPDSHAELTVGLLEAARSAFGEKGVMRIVEVRGRDQVNVYRSEILASWSLRRRVHALADRRTSEGYMAEVIEEKRGTYLLVEHHCPICEAAASCTGICASELDVFRRTLGEGVTVERVDHLLSGGERCAYRITAA